jgi:hypothetical protein
MRTCVKHTHTGVGVAAALVTFYNGLTEEQMQAEMRRAIEWAKGEARAAAVRGAR